MGYEQFRRWMIEFYSPAASGPTVDLLAGSLAGGTAILLTYPLDLARTRLAYHVANQSNGNVNLSQPQDFSPAAYKGIGDILSRVYKANGIRGCIVESVQLFVGSFPMLDLNSTSIRN